MQKNDFNMNIKLSLLFVAGILLLSFLLFQLFSGESDTKSVTNQAVLTNTYWKLIELGDRAIVTPAGEREMKLTLREEGEVTGYAGCNSFFGTYSIKKSNLKFNQLAASRAFCAEKMDTEKLFLDALADVNNYKITGKILNLSDNEGTSRVLLRAFYPK